MDSALLEFMLAEIRRVMPAAMKYEWSEVEPLLRDLLGLVDCLPTFGCPAGQEHLLTPELKLAIGNYGQGCMLVMFKQAFEARLAVRELEEQAATLTLRNTGKLQ